MTRSLALAAALVVALALLALPRGLPAQTGGEAAATPAPSPSPAGPAATPGKRIPGAPGGIGMRVYNLRYKKVDDAYMLISPYVGPRGTVKM